jgi:hypothetical protein
MFETVRFHLFFVWILLRDGDDLTWRPLCYTFGGNGKVNEISQKKKKKKKKKKISDKLRNF